MPYSPFEESLANALLREKLGKRAVMSSFQQTKFHKLPPGKKLALAWRLEAAHRVQAGRQPLTDFIVTRLSDRLPPDSIGLAEGIIYYTFCHPNRQVKKAKDERVQVDILPILWHLPGPLCNVLASEIMTNPGFDEEDLAVWLDKHDIDLSKPLPDLKHMRMEPAKK